MVDATAGDRVGLVTRAAAILPSLPGFCRIFPPSNTQRLPIAKLTPEILQDSLIIKFQCLVRPGKPQRRQSASDTACLRLLRSLLLTLSCRCPSSCYRLSLSSFHSPSTTGPHMCRHMFQVVKARFQARRGTSLVRQITLVS